MTFRTSPLQQWCCFLCLFSSHRATEDEEQAVQGTWTGISAGWDWEGPTVQVGTELDPEFCSRKQLLLFFSPCLKTF